MRAYLTGLAVIFVAVMLVINSSTYGHAVDLKGHKDRLFAYPGILEHSADGAFRVIDYDKMRDIYRRDLEPERRVRSNYVSMRLRKYFKFVEYKANGRTLELGLAGDFARAYFSVIFIHGRNGNKRLGMKDYTFGGNFNRLKNLVILNAGAYLTPSITSFDGKGAADVKALIEAGRGPVVLACASMGSFICSRLANDTSVVSRLAGMVLLGGAPDRNLVKSAAVRAKVPFVFAHGSDDTVYAWQDQKSVFDALRDSAYNYPAQFLLFNTGSHGTPIRMTDWKQVLEFVFSH